MPNQPFIVKFWGVRGTVPVAGQDTLKYGGNTSCVEVQCGGRQIIFDAGTGIYALGMQTDIFHTDILLSHTHLDHIMGLPFFRPLHKGGEANVALWAGHLLPEHNVVQVVGHIMQSPVFPLTIHQVNSRVEFNDFHAGNVLENQGLSNAGITVHTMPLHHPDRATAYRLECDGKVVCYVTDVEHEVGKIDQKIVDFIQDADVFIYDSTYDDDEFDKYVGWGHSTWQQGVRLADAANVKTFAIFHHDPLLTDAMLDERAEKARALRGDGVVVAYEGLTLEL